MISSRKEMIGVFIAYLLRDVLMVRIIYLFLLGRCIASSGRPELPLNRFFLSTRNVRLPAARGFMKSSSPLWCSPGDDIKSVKQRKWLWHLSFKTRVLPLLLGGNFPYATHNCPTPQKGSLELNKKNMVITFEIQYPKKKNTWTLLKKRVCILFLKKHTLLETNSSHLKIDAWKTTFGLLLGPRFRLEQLGRAGRCAGCAVPPTSRHVIPTLPVGLERAEGFRDAADVCCSWCTIASGWVKVTIRIDWLVFGMVKWLESVAFLAFLVALWWDFKVKAISWSDIFRFGHVRNAYWMWT